MGHNGPGQGQQLYRSDLVPPSPRGGREAETSHCGRRRVARVRTRIEPTSVVLDDGTEHTCSVAAATDSIPPGGTVCPCENRIHYALVPIVPWRRRNVRASNLVVWSMSCVFAGASRPRLRRRVSGCRAAGARCPGRRSCQKNSRPNAKPSFAVVRSAPSYRRQRLTTYHSFIHSPHRRRRHHRRCHARRAGGE
jgi:hypothetical protein